MTLDDLHALLLGHVGQRVRVTTLNGVGREAAHPTGKVGTWREYPTIGGYLVGGEYDNPVRVEVLGTNGRYQVVAP
jgi:hypothetical protein